MSDFEKVKKNLIETNEKNYGKEIKEEYGEEVYEATNDILGGLTEQQWLDSEQLRMKIESMLKELAPSGDPTSIQAVQMAELHGKWASIFCPDGMYSPEAHAALVKMYTDDQRFRSYYEAIVAGGAEFLSKAVENYVQDKIQ